MSVFLDDVRDELVRARQAHPRLQSSLHEGYAVMLEEVEEAWDIVKMKASRRDHSKLRAELVQVAAMAARMAEDAKL